MKKDLQATQIIHLALCLGVSFFGAVTLLLNGKEANFTFDQSDENIFAVVAIVIAAVASMLSGVLANRLWGNINKQDENAIKFASYRTGSIIQWALLEGAALVSLVGFLLHGNYFFLILGLAMLIIMFSKRPTATHVNEITGIPIRELGA